jgi:hypothetical protein
MSNAVGVTVYSVPSQPSIHPSGAVDGCTSVFLTADAISGVSYQWYSSGSPISGATGLSYTATSNGFYTVSVTSNNCTSSQSTAASVTIKGLPAKPSVSYSGNGSFCDNGTLSTSATGVNYQWYKYGSAISGATAQTYNATSSGNYQVEIINANGCANRSDAVGITVNTSPVKPTISQSGNGTYCGYAQLQASVFSTVQSYQWYISAPISGATNAGYTAYNSGPYIVRVTSYEGCTSSSDELYITVNTTPDAPLLRTNDNHCGSTLFNSRRRFFCRFLSVVPRWFSDQRGYGTDLFCNAERKLYCAGINSSGGCAGVMSNAVGVTVYSVPSQPSIHPSGAVDGCTSVS